VIADLLAGQLRLADLGVGIVAGEALRSAALAPCPAVPRRGDST
jgi:hypothetical protein